MSKDKTSVFLSSRIETLNTALIFFLTQNSTRNLVIFLSQIDFWDFEVESVIYCVESFKERQEQWSSKGSTYTRLAKNNICLKPAIIDKNNESYNSSKRLFTPINELNELIDTWNKLLSLSETLMINEKMHETLDAAGSSGYLRNLSKFRKNRLNG